MRIWFLLAASASLLAAHSGFYIGGDIAAGREGFEKRSSSGDTQEVTTTSTAAKVKLGYGNRASWSVELGVNMIEYNRDIYGSGEGRNVVVDIDIIKAYPTGGDLYPFVKLGAGAGAMTIKNFNEDRAQNIGVKLGMGLYYTLSHTVDVEVGIDVRGRQWQEMKLLGMPVDVSSSAVESYLGVNYRFDTH